MSKTSKISVSTDLNLPFVTVVLTHLIFLTCLERSIESGDWYHHRNWIPGDYTPDFTVWKVFTLLTWNQWDTRYWCACGA